MNHVYRCLDRLTDVIIFQAKNESRPVSIPVVTCSLIGEESSDFAVFITVNTIMGGTNHLYFRPKLCTLYVFDDFDGNEFKINNDILTYGVQQQQQRFGSINLVGIGKFLPCSNTPCPNIICQEGNIYMINKSLGKSIITEFQDNTSRRWSF